MKRGFDRKESFAVTMNLRVTFLASAVVLAALAGCYTGSAVDTNAVPTIVSSTAPTDPPSDEPAGDDDDDDHTPTARSGLPCDLAVLLEASCGECHGAKRPPNGPIRIASYDDLVAPSPDDPKRTIAELSLARMKSAKKPMPPDGKLGADAIEILEAWISGGMPAGSCGTSAGKPDAGKPGAKKDAGADATPPNPPPTSVCTSGVEASPDLFAGTMRPGKACIACHTTQMGPSFTIAGTVFPTSHEPDDCNGANGATDAVKVLIIDGSGAVRALPVNAAGNFMSGAALSTPYRAIVVRGNSIREMKSTQTDGDCNGCHSEWGKSGAPGRVMAP